MKIRPALLALLCLAGCRFGEWRGSHYTPPAAAHDVRIIFTKPPDGSHTPAGHVYLDLDGARGADRCLTLWGDNTWTLGEEPPGVAGAYTTALAAGGISEDGQLTGLPDGAFLWVRSAWREGDVRVIIEGSPVPEGSF